MRTHTPLVRRFIRNRSGATAIEFSMVFMPFLLLMLGIIGIGLFFLAETVLDQAVVSSIRQIRTGQSNASNLTIGQLKQNICGKTGGLVDCNKLSINVQSGSSWDGFRTTASCVNSAGSVVASNYSDDKKVSEGAGGREAVVVIVACYPWSVPALLPLINLGNVNGGSARLIRTVTAFKSEPY